MNCTPCHLVEHLPENRFKSMVSKRLGIPGDFSASLGLRGGRLQAAMLWCKMPARMHSTGSKEKLFLSLSLLQGSINSETFESFFSPSINKHKCVENYPNLLPKRMCLQIHFQYWGPQNSATIFRGDKNSPCISDQNPNIAYFFLPTENAPFYFIQFCLNPTLFPTFHSINVSFTLII